MKFRQTNPARGWRRAVRASESIRGCRYGGQWRTSVCKLYMCGRGIHQQAGRSPLWTPVCQQTFLILISSNAIELLPCATETVQLESALACKALTM